MNFKSTLMLVGILTLILAGCKSDMNSPGNDLQSDQLSYETVNSDLALMKAGGMPLDSAAGIFSIGWNEMFRPFTADTNVKGMAFAVAFGERSTDLQFLRKYGMDMGSVFLNYQGNHIEMNKRFHEMRGVAYDLFERPFGNCSGNLLQFVPNTEYKFEITGSEAFSPLTISLISPSALMNITNYNSGDTIDPSRNLTINWVGGNTDGKVAIRLMPDLRPPMGHMGGPGEMRPHHPPFDRVISVILDSNTGTYTFPSSEIQRILNGIDADGLRVEVSQMQFGEVEHPNGTIRTIMRNGGSVMLRIL